MTHRWKCPIGCTIDRAINHAIEFACDNKCDVIFEFNGMDITVNQNSTLDEILKQWGEKNTERVLRNNREQADTFQKRLEKAANERMAFIQGNRENILEAFLAETGLLPSQCVQVHQTMPDGTIRFWVEKKQE